MLQRGLPLGILHVSAGGAYGPYAGGERSGRQSQDTIALVATAILFGSLSELDLWRCAWGAGVPSRRRRISTGLAQMQASNRGVLDDLLYGHPSPVFRHRVRPMPAGSSICCRAIRTSRGRHRISPRSLRTWRAEGFLAGRPSRPTRSEIVCRGRLDLIACPDTTPRLLRDGGTCVSTTSCCTPHHRPGQRAGVGPRSEAPPSSPAPRTSSLRPSLTGRRTSRPADLHALEFASPALVPWTSTTLPRRAYEVLFAQTGLEIERVEHSAVIPTSGIYLPPAESRLHGDLEHSLAESASHSREPVRLRPLVVEALRASGNASPYPTRRAEPSPDPPVWPAITGSSPTWSWSATDPTPARRRRGRWVPRPAGGPATHLAALTSGRRGGAARRPLGRDARIRPCGRLAVGRWALVGCCVVCRPNPCGTLRSGRGAAGSWQPPRAGSQRGGRRCVHGILPDADGVALSSSGPPPPASFSTFSKAYGLRDPCRYPSARRAWSRRSSATAPPLRRGHSADGRGGRVGIIRTCRRVSAETAGARPHSPIS